MSKFGSYHTAIQIWPFHSHHMLRIYQHRFWRNYSKCNETSIFYGYILKKFKAISLILESHKHFGQIYSENVKSASKTQASSDKTWLKAPNSSREKKKFSQQKQ